MAIRTAVLAVCICLASCDEESKAASEPYFLLGIRAYTSGDLQQAHDAFTQCLELEATRTDCMTNLASVLVDMGNDQAAEELYRAVLAVEPDHADAAYNLALMLQDRRNDEAAISEAVHLYKRVVCTGVGARASPRATSLYVHATLLTRPSLFSNAGDG